MAQIDKTAVVDPKAELADDVVVGPYCVIGSGVSLGEGCRLMHHVTIMANTTCGRGNTFFPYCVVGAPAQDLKSTDPDTELVIGDNNIFREFVTVHRGTEHYDGKTTIGSGNYFMAYTHIAHDCVVEDGVIMANGVQIGGHCLIEKGANLGGLAAVHHFVTVGRFAFVGGLTRVVRDVPPFMVVEGNPADVRCVNTVGLRRRGFPEQTIEKLRLAHKLLFRTSKPISHALKELRTKYGDDENILHLADFVERTIAGKQGRAREIMRCQDETT